MNEERLTNMLNTCSRIFIRW